MSLARLPKLKKSSSGENTGEGVSLYKKERRMKIR
jgi:hypothetical protein